MQKEKIFLWLHMHQPDYYDPLFDAQVLPWVRRNLLRGYWLIPNLIKKSNFKVNINFSGSLLEQILRYSDFNFSDLCGKIEDKDPQDLDSGEKSFFLKKMLPKVNFNTQRYKMLVEKASREESFTDQELIDAQVLFKISAFAPLDDQIKALLKKGENFSKEDKRFLIELEKNIIKNVLPLYKDLLIAGSIEITFSPYHHPILPLLIDIKSAVKSKQNINIPLPKNSLLEDAKEQILRGKEVVKKIFNIDPKGMWPSEGSISTETIELARSLGVEWIGSDELVLQKNSNKSQGVYGVGGLKAVFRGHEVSDRIGFVYNHFPVDIAIKELREKVKSSGSIYIIIDGENPWESYTDSGIEFLTQFFQEFAESSILGSNVVSHETVGDLLPGSWIDGTFDTWVGNEECNTAWSYLYDAREKLGTNHLALEELLKAEASDYFWWYSDFHKHQVNGIFDELFRHRLIKSYKTANEKIPDYLFLPIK